MRSIFDEFGAESICLPAADPCPQLKTKGPRGAGPSRRYLNLPHSQVQVTELTEGESISDSSVRSCVSAAQPDSSAGFQKPAG